MRKLLLVLLVGLLSVASFAAVNFSSDAYYGAYTGIELTVDATGNVSLSAPVYGIFVASTSDTSTNTSFAFYFGSSFDTVLAGYVQQYLYKTDALSVRYRIGKPLGLGDDYTYTNIYATPWAPWGTWYVENDAAALALLFDMTSGDLTDSLGVYTYFPTATSVDLDVVNSLSFLYFDIDVAAKGIVSAGAGSFPEIGVDVTVDLGTALGLPEGSTFKPYVNIALDPAATDVTGMLSKYRVGVSFGYDTVKGYFRYESTNLVRVWFQTSALDPVTLGAWGIFPLDMTAITDLYLNGYLDWTYELLNNEIYVVYSGGNITAGWTVAVYY